MRDDDKCDYCDSDLDPDFAVDGFCNEYCRLQWLRAFVDHGIEELVGEIPESVTLDGAYDYGGPGAGVCLNIKK